MAADRDLYRDIETMVAVLRSGEIIAAVEAAVGEMKG
jgi:histidine ammonia-lyase